MKTFLGHMKPDLEMCSHNCSLVNEDLLLKKYLHCSITKKLNEALIWKKLLFILVAQAWLVAEKLLLEISCVHFSGYGIVNI